MAKRKYMPRDYHCTGCNTAVTANHVCPHEDSKLVHKNDPNFVDNYIGHIYKKAREQELKERREWIEEAFK